MPSAVAALGRVWVLTDRRMSRRPLADTVRAAVDGGARAVVLRDRDLPRDERAALADALRAVLAPAGGRLIVAGPDPLGGDAVHLSAAAGPPPTGMALVGRSCHDEAELAALSTEDYAFLSPVFRTASKPGYGPPLLPAGLARLAARSPAPVVALGGIGAPADAVACLTAGAAAVAVLGAVHRAEDPAAAVRALCRATECVQAVAYCARQGGVHLNAGEAPA
ncbi:MAG TPA: thiamine phosphate synthase [Pilimelia sp.]|nr:thiamine phosphate synthase [Pilimelia sp.]